MVLDKFQTHFEWKKCNKSKNYKNQLLQYRSTRNFMVKPNLKAKILIYMEKPSNIMEKQGQNGGLWSHYIAVLKGLYRGVGALASALK